MAKHVVGTRHERRRRHRGHESHRLMRGTRGDGGTMGVMGRKGDPACTVRFTASFPDIETRHFPRTGETTRRLRVPRVVCRAMMQTFSCRSTHPALQFPHTQVIPNNAFAPRPSIYMYCHGTTRRRQSHGRAGKGPNAGPAASKLQGHHHISSAVRAVQSPSSTLPTLLCLGSFMVCRSATGSL